jgi:beta-phosphoglucomutase-like phosphatase (HAD superfamily)
MVALDMAGTTVADAGAVEEAFQQALDAVGIKAGDLAADPGEYVRRTMGQSKITVFTELLRGDRHQAELANAAFEDAFDRAVDRGEVSPIPGAEEAFSALRGAGMRLCLTTGFSPATRDRIISALGWCHRPGPVPGRRRSGTALAGHDPDRRAPPAHRRRGRGDRGG